MAVMDKIYVHTWEDYCKVKDWVESHEIIFSDGKSSPWSEFFYYVEDEESFNKKDLKWGVRVLSTSQYLDAILWRDCDIPLIKEYLNMVYKNPEEYLILRPIPDYKVATKFKVYGDIRPSYIDDNLIFEIKDKEGNTCFYYEDSDKYNFNFEGVLVEYKTNWTSSCNYTNCNSLKAFLRKLRSYNIPSGYTVSIPELWNTTIKCK